MRTRTLTLAALLWLSVAGTCWGAHLSLTIALYDYAGLPPEVLHAAMKMVAQTLGDARIRAEWSFCPVTDEEPACTRHLLPDGRYVVINILAAGRGAGIDVAGFAIFDSARLHGARAFAAWDVVKEVAAKAHRRPSLVLACVVMHEIAHTLGLRHADGGVMQAKLRPDDFDQAACGLAFSDVEVRQLRKAVTKLNEREAE
jgi:hypothetical protein